MMVGHGEGFRLASSLKMTMWGGDVLMLRVCRTYLD